MRSVRTVIVSLAALAMVAGSTTAAATSSAPQAAAAQAPAPNAWMMLSVLSPTRAVALGGANSAAQPVDPPPPANDASARLSGELLPFILWFGLIAIALTINDGNRSPNSPA